MLMKLTTGFIGCLLDNTIPGKLINSAQTGANLINIERLGFRLRLKKASSSMGSALKAYSHF
jgi:hypothetical protein